MDKKRSSCTTLLVGKKASIDGSIMIGRNEDHHLTVDPKIFTLAPASSVPNREYHSVNTGVKVALPEAALRTVYVPQADPSIEGEYGQASCNTVNVAISATESVYGNPRVLAYDPLVTDGIAEDAINHIVAPFIKSARHGVEFLGALIEKYGSAEGNGILFADADEAWYMEIPCGHHWAAVRIPDDCYAVAPNQVSIEAIDFNDNANYLWSTGIVDFVNKYQLNPDREQFIFRHIFGTSNVKDRVYNTPRAWFIHRYLQDNFELEPTSDKLPFIAKANRLLSVEDVEYCLSSHYNETEFDPIGHDGTPATRTRFRSVSLSRTQESHIIQLDPKVPVGTMGICYLSFGTNAFTPYVPFFTNVLDTPAAYKFAPKKLDTASAYWLFKLLSYVVESHYDAFQDADNAYLYDLQSYSRRRILEVREEAEKRGLLQGGAERINAKHDPDMQPLADDALAKFLTEANEETAAYVLNKTKDLLSDLLEQSLSYSKMSFTMDKNL